MEAEEIMQALEKLVAETENTTIQTQGYIGLAICAVAEELIRLRILAEEAGETAGLTHQR